MQVTNSVFHVQLGLITMPAMMPELIAHAMTPTHALKTNIQMERIVYRVRDQEPTKQVIGPMLSPHVISQLVEAMNE